MAEEPRGEESSRYGNPFDAQSSGRDPFPSFEVALAEEQQNISALDWSIDTLAELKPVPFSPLPQQKDAGNTSGTPHGTSSFFEDEAQYEVLRTPLPAVRTSRETSRSRATLTTPTPTPPLELHRRCRETIGRCEARLRERQRKMDKLQAMLPPPTPQRLPRQRATPPSRSTPPRPAKRNRLSFAATPGSERKSMGMRLPTWSASPIPMTGSTQPLCTTPATLHFDGMTPSPLVSTPRNSTTQSSKVRLSFGLSPIAFPSPGQAQEEKIDEGTGEEEKPSAVSCNEETLPLSSTEESAVSSSPDSEKENGDQQAQRRGGREQGESSSSRAPSTTAKKAAEIPRRQQAFVEAIEAEARKSSVPRTAASSPSILSLYQEAKRLRMADPQAQ